MWGSTGSHVTGSDVSHVTGSSPDRKWRQSPGSMFCACATGSCAISAVVGPRKWRQSRDRKWRQSRDRKWPWPEEALSGSVRVRMCNRKLHNRFPRFFLLYYKYHGYRRSPEGCAHFSPEVGYRKCVFPAVLSYYSSWDVLCDVRVLYLAWLPMLSTPFPPFSYNIYIYI